jgi:esterase/lipase superfamily enzyme
MNREYVSWYSPALQKKMELLIFGHAGAAILFFPPRMGRFYDYENWRIIEALRPKIENGHIQVFCVDSYDNESFYSNWHNPYWKTIQHLRYEAYILNEVLPLINQKNPGNFKVVAGCSLGAYHALNIALKHSSVFNKVVAMSGRFDLTHNIGHYHDLFNGYWDENVYYNMPLQYVSNISDADTLGSIQNLEVVLVIGRDDILLENNWAMHYALMEKGVKSTLHVWDREMHRAKGWRQMVQLYL